MAESYTTHDGQQLRLGGDAAYVDEVIRICIDYLRKSNERVPSREAIRTIYELNNALLWQHNRQEDRQRAGVLGSDQPHIPLPLNQG